MLCLKVALDRNKCTEFTSKTNGGFGSVPTSSVRSSKVVRTFQIGNGFAQILEGFHRMAVTLLCSGRKTDLPHYGPETRKGFPESGQIQGALINCMTLGLRQMTTILIEIQAEYFGRHGTLLGTHATGGKFESYID